MVTESRIMTAISTIRGYVRNAWPMARELTVEAVILPTKAYSVMWGGYSDYYKGREHEIIINLNWPPDETDEEGNPVVSIERRHELLSVWATVSDQLKQTYPAGLEIRWGAGLTVVPDTNGLQVNITLVEGNIPGY